MSATKPLALIFLLLASSSDWGGERAKSTGVQAHRILKVERQSSLLEKLAEQEENETTDNLLDIDKDSVKKLGDKEIDQRLELLDVKLEQNNLLIKDQQSEESLAQKQYSSDSELSPLFLKDIETGSDGDFMSSVLERAEKQRDQDEKKKELEGKKELLQLEKQARKNKKHEKWVKEHNKKMQKRKKEEERKRKVKERADRQQKRESLMQKDAMKAILEEKNKMLKEMGLVPKPDGPHAVTREQEEANDVPVPSNTMDLPKPEQHQNLSQKKHKSNKKKGKKGGAKKKDITKTRDSHKKITEQFADDILSSMSNDLDF